jgi:hypothetical protein
MPTPKGLGHTLFLNSELTNDEWRIYSDNIALTRGFQNTIQGVLVEELPDTAINVADADFERTGNVLSFWTRHVHADDEDIAFTWHDIGQPMIRYTQPLSQPDCPYGASTVLIPRACDTLTVDSDHAAGRPQVRDWEGPVASIYALACAESWTECQ